MVFGFSIFDICLIVLFGRLMCFIIFSEKVKLNCFLEIKFFVLYGVMVGCVVVNFSMMLLSCLNLLKFLFVGLMVVMLNFFVVS